MREVYTFHRVYDAVSRFQSFLCCDLPVQRVGFVCFLWLCYQHIVVYSSHRCVLNTSLCPKYIDVYSSHRCVEPCVLNTSECPQYIAVSSTHRFVTLLLFVACSYVIIIPLYFVVCSYAHCCRCILVDSSGGYIEQCTQCKYGYHINGTFCTRKYLVCMLVNVWRGNV